MKNDSSSKPPPTAIRVPSDVLRVVITYAVFASLWILLSDTVVGWLFADSVQIVQASTIKGWTFVVVTSVLLYGLISRLRDHALAGTRKELAAQEEKARALQLLSAIADNSSDAIFAKDREGRYLLVNRAVEQIVGKAPNQMLGQDDTALFPLQTETIRTNDRDVMDENRVITYEETVATVMGQRTFLSTKGPLHDAQGQVTGMFGISRDITERQLAARQLAESEARREAEMRVALESQHQTRLAAMNLMEAAIAASNGAETALTELRQSELRWKFAIEGSGDGLWDWNVSQGTVFFSARWKSMLGFAPDEIGSGLDEWSKRIHPEDLTMVMTSVQAHLNGSTPHYVSEHRVSCKDGSWKWILDRGLVVEHDTEGKALRMIGTHTDVTERKVAERAQARLSQLYLTLSQSNQAIVHCDSEVALFPQICHDTVNFGGLKMAWIGRIDETGQRVVPVASHGDAADYMLNAKISMDVSNPRGQGPTATAIRESRPVWCQDFLHDPRTAPWHELGARAGWKASAALPLRRKGVTVGALTLYAREASFFDNAIQTLLVEMASDVSFGMDSYAAVAERKHAEEAMAAQLNELLRWQQLMLGRESRILTMKQEVNSLLVERGQPPRYPSAVDAETN